MSQPLSTLLPFSVVIPALEEAAALPATLDALRGQPGLGEVIVVDGGSTDGTPGIARGHGARVVHAPRGRARQMNAGAATAAPGAPLLFLHADTRLPPDGLLRAHAALARPGVVAGCFRLRFDQPTPLLRFYTLPIWMHWARLAFGDRALFVDRAAYDAVGGFPDQPLFEDLEMVRRLRRLGRFAFLPEAVVTSARRFRARGPLRQQLRNAVLWTAWCVGVSPERLAGLYPYDAAARGRVTPPPAGDAPDPRAGAGSDSTHRRASRGRSPR